MTATIASMFSTANPSRWNVLLAEDSDKDLDFDEGFEEDELHQSKPPSRRPLLWILLLLLVGVIAYWVLNDQSMHSPNMTGIETVDQQSGGAELHNVASPLFREDQSVTLAENTGRNILMGDPTNSRPGPLINSSEALTILDGTHQLTGWVYQVQTSSGKIGWIAEDKLKESF